MFCSHTVSSVNFGITKNYIHVFPLVQVRRSTKDQGMYTDFTSQTKGVREIAKELLQCFES
jgi:hypothetical protein